jgi:hypothetical protein
MQHTNERLQIRETQDSASSREHDKEIRWGQIGPCGRKRADVPRSRVMNEHPRLPPGQSLHEEGKLLAVKGVERMSDREEKVPIRMIGCSWRFTQMGQRRVLSID